MRRNEVTWKIEQLDIDLWVARSCSGVIVYADTSEKLREWFSGRSARGKSRPSA